MEGALSEWMLDCLEDVGPEYRVSKSACVTPLSQQQLRPCMSRNCSLRNVLSATLRWDRGFLAY